MSGEELAAVMVPWALSNTGESLEYDSSFESLRTTLSSVDRLRHRRRDHVHNLGSVGAFAPRASGIDVRPVRDGVLFFAGDPVLLGHLLGGLAHELTGGGLARKTGGGRHEIFGPQLPERRLQLSGKVLAFCAVIKASRRGRDTPSGTSLILSAPPTMATSW